MKAKISSISQQSRNSLTLNTAHHLLYFIKTHKELFNEAERKSVLSSLKKLYPKFKENALLTPLFLTSDSDVSDFRRKRHSDHHRRGGGGGKHQQQHHHHQQQQQQQLGSIPSALNKVLSSMTVPAELMEDIGYSCCATSRNLRTLFGQFPPLTEAQVAQIVGMMSRTHTGLDDSFPMFAFTGGKNGACSGWDTPSNLKTWNVQCFVDTLRDVNPKLSWQYVVKHLDHVDFKVFDSRGFGLIVSTYRTATKQPFPVDYLFGLWHNTSAQLSLLKLAVSAPPELFQFSPPPAQSFLDGVPPAVKAAIGTPRQHWFNLHLVKTLLGLAEVEHYALVRMIFDHPIKACPEILFLVLSQIKEPNALHQELCEELMQIFLCNHPNCSFVLNRVWFRGPALDRHNRPIVIRGMVEAYRKDPSCLPRLLDIAQMNLKALGPILDSRPWSFALDFAALAHKREYLNLAKWLQDRIAEHGDPFASACIDFLRIKLGQPAGGGATGAAAGASGEDVAAAAAAAAAGASPSSSPASQQPIAPETMNEFFNSLLSNASVFSEPVREALQLLQATRASQLKNEREAFPPFIEKTANSYFQQIYTGQLSIKEAIALLQAFQASPHKQEQDIFACMIHSLFDEYRFFPKYPDKELRITGVLFGQLIQHKLVTYIPLGIALRYVLEALRKAPNSKMFHFGLLALEQFRTRLPEWPQYCTLLLQVRHLQVHPSAEYIERALREGTAAVAAAAAGTANPAATAAAAGTVTNPSTVAAGTTTTNTTNNTTTNTTTNASPLTPGSTADGSLMGSQPQPQQPHHVVGPSMGPGVGGPMLTVGPSTGSGAAATAAGGGGGGGGGGGVVFAPSGGSTTGNTTGNTGSSSTAPSGHVLDAATSGGTVGSGAGAGAGNGGYPLVAGPGGAVSNQLPPPDMAHMRPGAPPPGLGHVVPPARGMARSAAGGPLITNTMGGGGGGGAGGAGGHLHQHPHHPSHPHPHHQQPHGQSQLPQPKRSGVVAGGLSSSAPAAGTGSGGGGGSSSSTPTTPSRSVVKSSKGGALSGSLPIDILLEAGAPMEEPPESVVDVIHFTFNNLTMSNLNTKLDEMMAKLPPRFMAFLARYLIIKRIAIEANFHPLYLKAVAYLGAEHAPNLKLLLHQELIRNLRVLLASEEITQSAPIRSLLKNLGTWLGYMTLARNKPLRHRDLALKDLLLDAYERGRLIAVVPFIAKVLHGIKESKAFQPPNVWTMAHLRLLVELYHVPDLKLNLKFETAVLCNSLGIDIKNIEPSRLLRDRLVRGPPFPDFNLPDGGPPGVPVSIIPQQQAVPNSGPGKRPHNRRRRSRATTPHANTFTTAAATATTTTTTATAAAAAAAAAAGSLSQRPSSRGLGQHARSTR